MKYFTILVCAVSLSGCAALSDEITKAAGKVQDGVDTYCEEVDQAAREKFRAEVNPTPDGNSITVECK